MDMELSKLIDHTLLKPDATEKDIKTLCEEAEEYDFASVCVNPFYVKIANQILKEAGVNPDTRVKDLAEKEITKLREIIDRDFKVEGDLRREVALNTKRLVEIGSYRGLRHRRSLPVRGQRTRTNARTRKGPIKTVGVKRGAK